MVFGENGIITKSKESRTETRMAQIDEQVNLAIGDAYTDGIGSITDSGLKSALNNRIGEGTYDISGDETTGWKVIVKETGKVYEIAANGKTDSAIDWDQVLDNAKKNPVKHEQQTETNDIGIGTDGLPVNMDLWIWQKININEIVLNKGYGSNIIPGYKNENIENGKIQGKVPAYIKPEGEDEFYKVTSMSHTFAYCEDLEEAPEEIPSGVTSFYYTFAGCSKLTKATISSSVTDIDGTFKGCSSLTEIEIPNTITQIGYETFSGCTNLKEILIPDSIVSIDYYAFEGCNKLTEIRIPEKVEKIAGKVFAFCDSLKNIEVDEKNAYFSSNDGILFDKEEKTIIAYPMGKNEKSYIIPSGVTKIGDSAFYGCTNFEMITIPESVVAIGEEAFAKCSNLTSMTIPTGINEILWQTFYECTSLTSIEIPGSVTSIGSHAFYGCTSLTSVTIPDSVTSIEYRAFYKCTSLTSITIPKNVTEIDYYAFMFCEALTDVYFEETTTPDFGYDTFYKNSGVKTTFHFKNQEIYDAFTESYYNKNYGEKSTDFNW